MTIEEMRRAMREKVVPEEVVPQNVINCLIDEDAEPPKLDAFAFLMRLRTLGIGSADFLNLLEGCDAPESVVNKIKQNPAMNLQGLVLTLESSGLTTEDYTRMLLTARQVWERTLTLRLERSEQISNNVKTESERDASEATPEEEVGGETEESAEETEDDFYYDEDLQEMSFTAVFNKINEEIREGILTAETPEAETESVRGDAQSAKATEAETESIREDARSAKTPEAETKNVRGDAQTAAPAADEQNGLESEQDSFLAAFDKIKSEKRRAADKAEQRTEDIASQTANTGTVGDTTMIVGIDEESLRERFDKLSEETGEPSDEPLGEASEKGGEDAKTDDDPKENAPEYDTDETDEEENTSRVYHKGAIIGGAVGAAVLVGAGFFIGQYAMGKDARSFHYAEDSTEIFNKIYYAYEDSTPGGGSVYAMENGDCREIFGDLLIGGGENQKGFVSFSYSDLTYTLSEDAITVCKTENGTVTPLEALVPPEKARFVAAFDDNGKLYAMFSGKQSGFMKISGGKAELTVQQDGVLTDFDMSDGEMRLGTVYTPSFGHTFEISDEDMYLPRTGTAELKPISAQNVIISETNGYSYGVSAEYSAENGELRDVCAVIGDPAAASADGRFALNSDKGILLKAKDDKFAVEHTEKLSRAAFYKNGCAVVAETPEDGSVPDIMMFDTEFKHKVNLTGLSEEVKGMWFDGGVLTIKCGSGSFICADCTKLEDPKPLAVKPTDGAVMGSSALTFAVDDKALVITRYDLENGAAKKTAEYSKELSSKISDVRFGGAQTAVINGNQSGVAYSYFDDVSMISEYVVFADGTQPRTVSVFDDKTGGFTAAWSDGGTIKAVCGEGVKVIQ